MNFLLPHIGELNFNRKAVYLGYMVKRLLDVYSGSENDTDRDSYSRKRIEPSGILIKNLFREYYIMQMKDKAFKLCSMKFVSSWFGPIKEGNTCRNDMNLQKPAHLEF